MILKTHPENGMDQDQLIDAARFCEALGGFLETPVQNSDGTWRAVLRFWQQPLLAEQIEQAAQLSRVEHEKRLLDAHKHS